jgi:hypothetical protein
MAFAEAEVEEEHYNLTAGEVDCSVVAEENCRFLNLDCEKSNNSWLSLFV